MEKETLNFPDKSVKSKYSNETTNENSVQAVHNLDFAILLKGTK